MNKIPKNHKMNFAQQLFLKLSFVKKLLSEKKDSDSSKKQPEVKIKNYKHDAFICYSRKNEPFAGKLEDAAEGYKPPKDLRVPQGYLDLFRDKKDFAVGDYFDNRDRHLRNSTKLIVICSPEARKSQYVNDEIKQFALLRGSNNIIPLLFSGIPNNEVLPGQEEEMAFPEALCEVMKMPLAINYLGFDLKKDRLNKGIFSDSWFSLLAAIYGISRAEVEQREKRRRVRLRKITYSVLGVSVIVLSVLLIFIWISRNEAVDRKVLAEAARLDALASGMFAESRGTDAQRELELERLSQLKEEFKITEVENIGTNDSLALRLSNLKQEISQTEQKLKVLERHSRTLRRQGKIYLTGADEKWSAIHAKRESWTAGRSRPSIPTLFSLELLSASTEGKCMILHYGDIDDPKFILIGGGLNRNYQNMLMPRLQQIKGKWSPDNPLLLEIVIAGEMDVQSIGGLIAMTDSLASEQELNKLSFLNIGTIWYNSFQPQPERWAKARLSLNAKKLNIRQNTPFDYFVMRPDSAAVSVSSGPLKITVIHPDLKRLKKLGKLWAELAKNFMDSSFEEKIPEEKFSSKTLKINKAPAVSLDSSVFKGHSDQSVVNLASICLVFELNNKRILFTGDAVGDDVLKGLHAAGYLSEKGTTHMDVLVLPHSASDRNVSKDFFQRVTADNYILFGDGTHNNPEVTTLKMLEEATIRDTMTMFFVNRDGRNNHGNRLDKYFLDNEAWAKQHRRVFRRFDEQNLIVNILEPIRY